MKEVTVMKIQIETITPAIAKEYLEHNVKNRTVCKPLVLFYSEMMKKGEWLENGDSIRFGKSGNLLDGQHRLMAIQKSGVSINCIVVRNIDDDAFYTIDTGKKRSAGDVFSIEGIPNSNRSSAIVFKMITGKVNRDSTDKQRVSKGEILNYYNENKEEVDTISQIAGRVSQKMPLRKIIEPTVIGFIAYKIHKAGFSYDYAEKFLTCVFVRNTSKCTTIDILSTRLLKTLGETNKMETKYKLMLIYKTFNAFATGKELGTLKWTKETEGDIELVKVDKVKTLFD